MIYCRSRPQDTQRDSEANHLLISIPLQIEKHEGVVQKGAGDLDVVPERIGHTPYDCAVRHIDVDDFVLLALLQQNNREAQFVVALV